MRLLISRLQVRSSDVAEFLIGGLFLLFLIAFFRGVFCRVFASVCEASPLCNN